MPTRLASLLVICFSIAVAGACRAQDPPLPAESSFIIRLADEAIVADGAEAIRSRSDSRSVFANAFLDGYSNPESTIPVNPALSSSRINGAGWSAGQAYRRANPDSAAQVMQEYGYTEFEDAGAWTVGFEAGWFQPDSVEPSSGVWPQSCWYLKVIRNAELNAQLSRVVPRDAMLRSATLRVRVKGYVSGLGQFGHLGMCQRQAYAISVIADAG